MLSKFIQKPHGRSLFKPEQAEYIAEKIHERIMEGRINSSKETKAHLLDLSKEYLLGGGLGNDVKDIGQTTMYNFLQRHGIPCFSKAGKLKPQKANEDQIQKKTIIKKPPTQPTDESSLIKKLEFHKAEIAKLTELLANFEKEAEKIESKQNIDIYVQEIIEDNIDNYFSNENEETLPRDTEIFLDDNYFGNY